jgi:hypothetical protein
MTRPQSTKIETRTAIAAPAAFALPAVERILREFADPGNASLALNISELHLPFQAVISVPVQARVAAGAARNEWRLEIRAADRAQLYPVFEGTLRLQRAGHGSELHLEGAYAVPLGTLGRAIDATVLRGAAGSSLQRFVREIAHRVAAISQWTHIA